MNALIDAISTIVKIIGYRTSREFSYFLDKLVTNLAVLTLACIFVFIGLSFIVWAIYLSFNSILTPPLAALVTGGITIIFSIAIVLIVRLLNRHKENSSIVDCNIENMSLKDFAKNMSSVKDNPLLAMALTVIAGYLIGSSPSARDALAEVIVKLLDQNLKTKE
jgi:glycerol-3-phosphate acyltransferase PlsY